MVERNKTSSRDYELLVRNLLSARLPNEAQGIGVQVRHNVKIKGKSGHDHQIDVAVDLQLADLRFLVAVECKLYARPVGIDDVLELSGRLDDIGAHKGVIVSTKGFDKGALKLAKSKGIALATAHGLEWQTILRFDQPYSREAMANMISKRRRAFERLLTWFSEGQASLVTKHNATELLRRDIYLATEPFSEIPLSLIEDRQDSFMVLEFDVNSKIKPTVTVENFLMLLCLWVFSSDSTNAPL